MWKNNGVAAYVVLLLAVLSRFLPHALHTAAWGATALGGGLLFTGSRLAPRHRWHAIFAVVAIALSDWVLTREIYGFPFHPGAYIVTWAWYGLLCIAASSWLYRHASATRVLGAALASSTGFFVLSNGMVWASGTMYPRTASGLGAAYLAGLPFYRNDLISTLVVCGVLFGLPALARRLSASAEQSGIAA